MHTASSYFIVIPFHAPQWEHGRGRISRFVPQALGSDELVSLTAIVRYKKKSSLVLNSKEETLVLISE